MMWFKHAINFYAMEFLLYFSLDSFLNWRPFFAEFVKLMTGTFESYAEQVEHPLFVDVFNFIAFFLYSALWNQAANILIVIDLIPFHNPGCASAQAVVTKKQYVSEARWPSRY